MPQVAAAAVGAASTLGVGATIAIRIGTMVVLSQISRKLAERKARKNDRQNNQREYTVRATDAYETFVYGRAMVAGVTVYNNASTVPIGLPLVVPNNRYYHVVEWVGHRVNCMEYFRLDDRYLRPAVDSVAWNPATYQGSGYVQTGLFKGTAPSGASYVGSESPTRLRWYLGNQTSADHWLDQVNQDWELDMVGRERAYGVLEIVQIDQDNVTDRLYQQGIPQNIWAYVHGKSVYDTRRFALNGDPRFGTDARSWWFGIADQQYTESSQLTAVHSQWSLHVDSHLAVRGVGGITDCALRTSSVVFFASELIPVRPDSYYTLRMDVRQTSGTNIHYPLVAFFTSAGSHINGGESNAVGFGLGTWHYWGSYALAAPGSWSTYRTTMGSGLMATMPTSARYARVGVLACYSGGNLGVQEYQQIKLLLGTSEQLVDISSTWEYSEVPALCAADYLRNERFGFGRESRQVVNASRYALNGDPCWRRNNTLGVTSHWRSEASGAALNTMPCSNTINLTSTGPRGRRSLLSVNSIDRGGVGAWADAIRSDAVPVDPSGHYAVSLSAQQSGTGHIHYFGIIFTLANGGYLDPALDDAVGWSEGAYHYFSPELAGVPLPQTWSSYVFAIGSGTGRSIPTSARFAALLALPRYLGSGPSAVEIQEYQIQPSTQIKSYIEPWEQIGWRSVSSAVAWNAEQVSTPSGTQARFTCNGQGNTGRSYRDNLRDLLGAGNLRATYEQSGWLMFGGWVPSAFGLNRADLRGRLGVRPEAESGDRLNGVRPSLYDRHQDHKLVPGAIVTADEYVARDGSLQLFDDVELPFTHDWFEAQRVAFGHLEQGDNQMIVRLETDLRGLGVPMGRQVPVRVDPLSWSPKYFMPTEAVYDLQRGRVEFTLREDFQASYVDPTSAEYRGRTAPNVSSATPHVPMVSSVTATYLGRDGVRLRWVNPSNRSFEWIDVYRDVVSNVTSGVPAANSFALSSLVKSTRNDEYSDPNPFDGNAEVSVVYWLRTRDFADRVSSVYLGPTSGFQIVPTVPNPASLTATYLGREGVRLRWVNPTSSPFVEKTGISRQVVPPGVNSSGLNVLLGFTKGDEYFDPDPFGGVASRDAVYHLHNVDHVGNQSALHPVPGSGVVLTPFPIAQISSVVVTPRVEGNQLRWINPSSSSYFEWIDIYRREGTNAFSGSSLIKSTRNDEYLDPLAVGDNFKVWYYWFRTRDWVGNQSSVYPGLTTSFWGSSMPAVARDPEFVFLEEFNYQTLEQFEQRWRRVTNTAPAGLTFPQSGFYGGRVLSANSTQVWYVSQDRIPYDAAALYRMRARSSYITSRDGQNLAIIGVAGYAADGVTLIDRNTGANADGNQHYFVVSGLNPSSAFGEWAEHTGHLSGHMPEPNSGTVVLNVSRDPALAARMRDGVKYISPLFILNYGSGTAHQAIDYMTIEKVRPAGLVYDPLLNIESNWFMTPQTGVASLRHTDVASEFGIVTLPSCQFTDVGIYERFRPDFHKVAPQSFQILGRARIYVGSLQFTGYSTRVGVRLWTRAGSLAYDGISGAGGTLNFATDRWVDISNIITVVPSISVNASSFPPPWFVTLGVHHTTQDVNSHFIAQVDGSII